MPPIDLFADLQVHLFKGVGAGDGVPVDEAGTHEDSPMFC